MSAHTVIPTSNDLAIEPVQPVVEGTLADRLPGPSYYLRPLIDGVVICGEDWLAAEPCGGGLGRVSISSAVGRLDMLVVDEDQVAVPALVSSGLKRSPDGTILETYLADFEADDVP